MIKAHIRNTTGNRSESALLLHALLILTKEYCTRVSSKERTQEVAVMEAHIILIITC